MAESMTYDSLKADIKSYANREGDDFEAQIPRLIMLAENRLASEIRSLGFIRIAEFSVLQGQYFIEKPARWRETSSFMLYNASMAQFLKNRSYGFCKAYWPDKTLQDTPTFYCDYDYEHFLLVSTPDTEYSAELRYFERPQPLDDTNQTNWTTKYAPQLILFAALLEAQPWVKNDGRFAVFQDMYNRAASGVMEESARRQAGDEALMRNEG